MNYSELKEAILSKKSYLCVGLDPEVAKLPEGLQRDAHGVLAFNHAIIDATRDYCVAYKPNSAFYESLGDDGMAVLRETIEYIGKNHLVILDAKRGDLGNTAKGYRDSAFYYLQADAITLNPYMGLDSLEVYFDDPAKWGIVLGLTSNPGAADFEMLKLSDGSLLAHYVIRKVAEKYGTANCMFVVGATRPDDMAIIRNMVPHHFFLVPGVGAQGGDLRAVSQAGLNGDCGLLVNVSRAIQYASAGADYAMAARHAAADMQQVMEEQLRWKGLI